MINIYRTLHDRYALIFPSVGQDEVVKIGTQIKTLIEADPIPVQLGGSEALRYPIRVKLGVVSVSRKHLVELPLAAGDTVQLLTRQLNGALRLAKEQGGSQICCWDSDARDYVFTA